MIQLSLYLALALIVSFLCSIVEAVILSVTTTFIHLEEHQGKTSTRYLEHQKNNIDRPLSAILTINTIAHTVGAAGVGAQAVAVFGEIYFGLISAILTFLILFFSEIIPKTIGATYWRNLALPSAVVIQGMIYISFPLVWIAEFITRNISGKSQSQAVTREEVIAMAKLGTEDGVLKESESKIINNLIKLKALNVRDIMTPRTVVVAASEDTLLEEYIKQKGCLQYSRIPVYQDSIDNVTGYVIKSDVLEKLAKSKSSSNFCLKDLKRSVTVCYEQFSIPKLFEELLLKKEHMALIIDEYGGMQGLATMEDIIETILGLEIMDENDTEVDMQELARKHWELRKKSLDMENG